MSHVSWNVLASLEILLLPGTVQFSYKKWKCRELRDRLLGKLAPEQMVSKYLEAAGWVGRGNRFHAMWGSWGGGNAVYGDIVASKRGNRVLSIDRFVSDID